MGRSVRGNVARWRYLDGFTRARLVATVARMADEVTVVYLPGIEGCRTVCVWRLRVDGGFDRVVTAGTLRDGRWWVAALWEYPTGYGRVCVSEQAAETQARTLRETQDAHPGMWVCEERNVDPA